MFFLKLVLSLMFKFRSAFAGVLALLSVFLLSSLAMAQEVAAAVDVSAAVTAITTDAVGAVTSIGTAILTLAAVAVAFKWAKAAIFG